VGSSPFSGKHAVALAIRWPASEHNGLLGFAIRRTNPDRTTVWLQTVLRFEGEPITKGSLYDSAEAPIQSMIWCDVGLNDDGPADQLPAGSRFVYEVIQGRRRFVTIPGLRWRGSGSRTPGTCLQRVVDLRFGRGRVSPRRHLFALGLLALDLRHEQLVRIVGATLADR